MSGLLPTLTVRPFCKCCLLNPSLKCSLTYEMYSALSILTNKCFTGLLSDFCFMDVDAHFRNSSCDPPARPFLLSPSMATDALDCLEEFVADVKVSGLNSAFADSKDISFPVIKC